MQRGSLALWLLAVSALQGQQYPFVLTPNSPKNIEFLVKDHSGRLWLSTHDNVWCFDGARFFSLREFGFPPVISYSLAVDDEGAVLSATDKGVYRFTQGRLEHILSGPKVLDVISVASGLLLASGSERIEPQTLPNTVMYRLYRIRETSGGWNWERLSDWEALGLLSRDANGNVLTVCPQGWCELSAKLIANWRPGDTSKPLLHPDSTADLQRVHRDRQGCLWFRSVEGGTYQCPGDTTPIRLPVSVAGRNVWAAEVENGDGNMLFANAGSIALGRPRNFQVATPEQGLPTSAVSSALRAPDGTLWIGTIDGLYRFPYPFRLEQWRSQYGLVWAFARTGGRMFAGTSAEVTYLNDERQWQVIETTKDSGSISSLLPDGDGNLYATVSHQAVMLLSRSGKVIARSPGTEGRGAETLVRTPEGEVWLAGAGVHRVRRQGTELRLEREEPTEPDVPAQVAVDPRKGEIWACSPGALRARRGGKWQAILTDGKLPTIACSAMVVDGGGGVWLGYPSLQLLVEAHEKNGRATLRRYEAGSTGNPFMLGFDSRGWLWRGSSDGIYVSSVGRAQKALWSKLDESDGLINIDANRRCFFSDADSSVWWAADTDIVHFLPPPDLADPQNFTPVFLSGFSMDGGVPRLGEEQQKFRNGSRLTAHFGSLQFAGRTALRVRYRWLPEQKDWRNAQSMDVELGTSRWGEHSLEFQSRLNGREWSPTISRSFVVLRPWWLSWQSLLICGACCVGTVGALRWQRERRGSDLPDLTDWRMAAISPEIQWVGSTLDNRYQLESLIAVGGFASVLKGRDKLNGDRACAVKIFREELLDRNWTTHRFLQEVSALEKILHPSVVSIYGHGVTPDETPYLVMEYIEGVTLRDLLNLRPISPARAGSLLRQMADALSTIHPLGIYHRDLKPENLMIRFGRNDGEDLVLIDFSIAIVKEPDKTMHGLSRAAGTIYYMAPEQAIGIAGPASDIYSLTKILLEMLTGERLSALLPDAAMDMPERVKEMLPTLGVGLSTESIEQIGSALEFHPSQRPQDARAFAEPICRDLAASKQT